MNQSPKYLIEILVQNGFELKRSKGSHQIFYNAKTGKTVVVPVHGGKDVDSQKFLMECGELT